MVVVSVVKAKSKADVCPKRPDDDDNGGVDNDDDDEEMATAVETLVLSASVATEKFLWRCALRRGPLQLQREGVVTTTTLPE